MAAPAPALAATRRGFLQLAASAAALGALGRLALHPPTAGAAAAGGGLRFFDAAEAEILTQVVERMVASGDPSAPRVRDTRALASIDALCAGLDPGASRPLPALLQLVEWSPLLFDLRAARFTSLPDAEQDACLRGWMTSRFSFRRLGFAALRNLAFFGWYAQPESWPAIGYRGPLLARGAP